MSLDLTSRATFTTSAGNEYSYIHVAPKSNASLLFLHGFPSTLYDWIYQIQYFSSRGYGVIVPDLLGYGESSKPSDARQYRLKLMSDDINELLEHLHVLQVVGIGHDFGATLLSRLATYYPSRWTALVFLAVGPPKLGTPFDVEAINQMTKKAMGFEMLGYIPWIGGKTDAEVSLGEHAEAAMSLMFSADRKVWDEWFHPLGKMREFVQEDKRVQIGSWYNEEMKHHHLETFGKSKGYLGATRWYQMWMNNLFAPDEEGFEEFRVSQPALFIEPETDNPIQEQMLAAWVPNLTTLRVISGHWVHLEQAEKVNEMIAGFLTHFKDAK